MDRIKASKLKDTDQSIENKLEALKNKFKS